LIKLVQLDPNGLCNLGCWFCPVAYEENPILGRNTMSIETIRSIIEQLKDGVGEFVDPSFSFIYTAHYNEVLLYKHFQEMLDLFREHNIRTMVLTNGSPLTKDKMDIIKEYSDVVDLIHFNTPSADSTTWAKMTGKPKKMHQKVMDNIRYAIDNFPNQRLSMQVNGINNTSLAYMDLLENAPFINLDDNTGDTATAVKQMKESFPEINIYANTSLVDRAGYLDTRKIMKNNIDGKGKVVGCNNMGSRPDTWIHINANGAVFLCCNDYDFETIFGNVNDTSIKDIWESQERNDMIDYSYKNFCTTCTHAIWEDK
jgi:radical SAM protein with 4Fe4S-binding SPASM domain